VRHAALLLLLLGGVAGALVGCGGEATAPAQLRLEREDLIAISRALTRVQPSVQRELVAAHQTWPLIAGGLPTGPLQEVRTAVKTAANSATGIALLSLLGEAQAASLTGPTALLAGLFRTYRGLVTRGWLLTGSAIDQIKAARASTAGALAGESVGGTTPAVAIAGAHFARANVALYIESIYDGHFDLAQIGKKLSDAYTKLGGPAAFGSALTPAQVSFLAHAYSEETARLHPHVKVRLGS
jgi:hypothetical protein